MAPRLLIHLPQEVQSIIAEHLSPHDLSQLLATCKIQYNSGVRTLYYRNSRYGQSSAISMAAMRCTEPIAIRVMRISLAHGGNVNAMVKFREAKFTALHVVTARGFRKLARLLLKNGASVSAEAINFLSLVPDLVKPASQSRLRSLFAVRASHQYSGLHLTTNLKWLPLFLPYILRDTEMIQLLIDARAPSNLTERLFQPQLSTLTMLHAAIILELEDEVRDQLEKRPQEINIPMVGSLATALHLAVSSADLRLVKLLIASSAKLDAYDDYFNVPLHTSIDHCTRALPELRKGQPDIAKALIDAGTAVDIRRRTFVGQTPAIYLASKIRERWNEAHFHIKAMFNVLIEKGADLNATANQFTVLSLVYHAITTRRKSESTEAIQKLFEKLAQNEVNKADVNRPVLVRGQHMSLMMKTMSTNEGGLKTFAGVLVGVGARLLPGEVRFPLLRWSRGQDLAGNYKILQHRDTIAPELAHEAFRTAFYHGALERLKELQGCLLFTPDYDAIVAGFLVSRLTRSLPLPRMDFPIDPGYRLGGAGFLHLVVEKLRRSTLASEGYTEEYALQDATALLRKGVLANMQDSEGLTAIQLAGRRRIAPPRGDALAKLQLHLRVWTEVESLKTEHP